MFFNQGWFKNFHIHLDDYVPPAIFDGLSDTSPVILLKAAQGRGKTLQVVNYVKRYITHDPNPTVLFITSRISQGEQLHAYCNANGVPLSDYREGGFGDHPVAFVQLDSLVRFMTGHSRTQLKRKYSEMCHKYGPNYDVLSSLADHYMNSLAGHIGRQVVDVVICDESEAMLSHIFSRTMADRRIEVFSMLYYIIKAARRCIFIDADLGDSTVDFALSCRINDPADFKGSEVSLHWLLAEPPMKTIYVTNKRQLFDDMVVTMSTDKEHALIGSDSKAEANRIADCIIEYNPTVRVQRYTADTDDQLKRELRKCETEWPKLDFVVHSPTITYALSFNPPNPHFDRQAYYFTARSINASDAFQMVCFFDSFSANLLLLLGCVSASSPTS